MATPLAISSPILQTTTNSIVPVVPLVDNVTRNHSILASNLPIPQPIQQHDMNTDQLFQKVLKYP